MMSDPVLLLVLLALAFCLASAATPRIPVWIAVLLLCLAGVVEIWGA